MVGSSGLSVGINLFLRDQFSGPAARVKSSANSVALEMRRMQEAQLRYQRNLYGGLAMAGAATLFGMGRMIKKASEFGYEMQFVGDIAQSTKKEQKAMSQQAMKLGQETIFTGNQVASGMRYLAMSGMKYKDVMGSIGPATHLAAAAMLDIAGRGGAADIMTNIMRAFRLGNEDGARVADILAVAATNANTNVQELGDAIKYSASTAIDLGVNLEQLTAMSMTLADAGMQSSMAGVAMENALRYITRATGDFATSTQKKAMNLLGLSKEDFRDTKGNLIDITKIIKKVKTATAGMGTGMKKDILGVLFGTRGNRAASLLMRNYDTLLGHLEDFTNAEGRALSMSESRMNTLKGAGLKVKSAWSNLAIMFTSTLEPVLTPLLKVIQKIAETLQKVFSKPILGGIISSALTGFITVKTVMFAYRSLMAGIRLLQIQSGNSLVTMGTKGSTAFSLLNAKARKYAATMSFINTQNTRAVMGSGGMMGFNRNLFRGKGGYFVRTAQGGYRQFSQKASAAKFARQNIMNVSSRAGLAAGALRGANAIKMTGLLGKVVGFLGGPIGLALSFILPGVIGGLANAIRKHKDSLEENTKETMKENLRKRREEMKYTKMGHLLKFTDLSAPSVKVVGSTSATGIANQINQQDLMKQAEIIKAQLNQEAGAVPSVLNINLDGETIFSERVDKILKEKEEESKRSLGF